MVGSSSAPPPAAGLEEEASKDAATVGGSTPVSHFDEWAQEEEEDGDDRAAASAAIALPFSITTAGPDSSSSSSSDKPPPALLLARPFSTPNLALTVGPLVYGIVTTFFRVPIGYYILQDLRMSATASNVCSTMLILPQAFQLPLGLLTDTVPIYHQRRRPYLLIGWGLVAGSMAGLAAVGKPSFATLMAFVFLTALGGQLVDVTTKATLVQRSESEDEKRKGTLVVTASLCASVGSTIGVLLGTFFYKDQFHREDTVPGNGGAAAISAAKSLSLGQIGLVNALLATVVMAPCLFCMHDPRLLFVPPHEQQQQQQPNNGHHNITSSSHSHWRARPLREELGDVWKTVQRTSLLYPMLFVGIYQAVWCPNSAWDLFLVKGLGFSEWKLGMLALAAMILGTIGAAIYRFFLMRINWRYIFVITMIVMVLLDCLQLILVFRLNAKWGVSDFFFALGDTATDSMVEGLHQMPINIMYLTFCPRGAEGTTLAVLQTFTSLANMVANNIALLLLRVWDVSGPTITGGDFSGVWRLTLLTSALQAVGVAGVFMLPTSVRHQKERQRTDKSSRWGGLAFVAFVVVAFVWTVAIDVYFLATGKGEAGDD